MAKMMHKNKDASITEFCKALKVSTVTFYPTFMNKVGLDIFILPTCESGLTSYKDNRMLTIAFKIRTKKLQQNTKTHLNLIII